MINIKGTPFHEAKQTNWKHTHWKVEHTRVVAWCDHGKGLSLGWGFTLSNMDAMHLYHHAEGGLVPVEDVKIVSY